MEIVVYQLRVGRLAIKWAAVQKGRNVDLIGIEFAIKGNFQKLFVTMDWLPEFSVLLGNSTTNLVFKRRSLEPAIKDNSSARTHLHARFNVFKMAL